MSTGDVPPVLVAVSHPWLSDVLTQLLRKGSLETVAADNLASVFARMRQNPAAILIDPFAFNVPGLELLSQLRQEAPASPIIVLIPTEACDYRDTVMRLGANGVVAIERAAMDLLPIVRQLIDRTTLVNGIADQIAQTAGQSTPIGEAAFHIASSNPDLKALSEQAVEQLSQHSDRISPATPMNHLSQATTNERTVLRGLRNSASSPVGGGSVQKARTACNLNCGSHFCGLAVTVRDQHIVKIEPADFPDERYRRICLKGISHVQMVAHPDRLLYPLKRAGARGEGKWQRITWDQAFEEIAGRMKEVIVQSGPESLMFFPYSGQLSALNGMNGVYLRLASFLGASGSSLSEFGLDSAVPSGLEDTLGHGAGYRANDYEDLLNSRLILIWGADPAQSRMNWWPFFLEAKRAGAKLIAIDPKFGITASKCDEWLAIRPGSDLYLALAMLKVIIDRGWIDAEFVSQHTAALLLVRDDDGHYFRGTGQGTERFRVWDEAAGKAIRAEEAQTPSLTGRYEVKGIACRPAFDLLKQMLERYTPDYAAQKTGIPADRILALAEAYATTKPARIFTLYGVDRWHHGATFGRLIATLAALTGNLGIPGGGAGVDGFSEGILFASKFTAPGGKSYRPVNPATLPDQIVRGQPYPIKVVITAFNNWVNQWPDQNYLRHEVLPRLDLLVTVDHFMTETARCADYVLPAATLFEREDMVKGPGPYLQYQPVIVPPPGECRSDFDIAAGLAQRLGGADLFEAPGTHLAQILAESDVTLSFEDLRSRGVLSRKLPPEAHVAHHDLKFNTPTGRVEFYVERLLPFGRALPDYEAPIEADPDGTTIRRYPLVCLTEHSRYRVHSTFVNAPWLREIDHEPRALIHPSEAQPRHITDGDLVRLYNDRGYAVLRARISQSVPPGTVYLSQGWQSEDFRAGHAQTLTHRASNPANALGANMSLSDVLVEIVREGQA